MRSESCNWVKLVLSKECVQSRVRHLTTVYVRLVAVLLYNHNGWLPVCVCMYVCMMDMSWHLLEWTRYAFMFLCMYVCIHEHLTWRFVKLSHYVCMYVWAFTFARCTMNALCMYIYACIYVCMYIYIYIYVCMSIYLCTLYKERILSAPLTVTSPKSICIHVCIRLRFLHHYSWDLQMCMCVY
jgi:hypothetical protein